jgi:hypothetical protein
MKTEHADWHPMARIFNLLQTVLPIDFTRKNKDLLEKEVWWQENVGYHKFGLNKRNDLTTVSRRRNK